MNTALFRGILLFSCFLSAVALAQEQAPDSLRRSVDSLRQRLQGAKGAERYELAFKIAYDLFDVDNPEAVKYAEEAFETAKELGDSATIVRSGRIYGQLLWRVGELNRAIHLMETMISTAERCNYEKDVRFLANSLAIACTIRGMYDKALHFSFKSLELREKRGDKVEIAIAQNVVGTTFYSIGIYDRAAEFLKKSLATNSEHNYVPDLKITLALCYAYLNYIDESKSLIQSVVKQGDHDRNRRTWSRIQYGFGLINWRQNNLDSAVTHFLEAYEIAKTESDKNLMSDCLAKLGDVYLTKADLVNSEKALLESELVANEIGYRNGTEVANMLLSRLYSLKMDHGKASMAKSKVIALRDSSISQGVFDNIFRYQFDYYEKQHTKTIATQAELLLLKEKTIRSYAILNIVFCICAVLLISVVVLLYRRNQLKRQIAIDLEKRIHERTSDLRVFDEALHRARLEKNFILEGITRQVNANLATFKGLGVVAKTYDGIPQEFINGVNKASDELTLLLQVIAISKK